MYDNKFSVRNSKLYKMKCLNTRDAEYKYLENIEFGRIEKYDDKR